MELEELRRELQRLSALANEAKTNRKRLVENTGISVRGFDNILNGSRLTVNSKQNRDKIVMLIGAYHAEFKRIKGLLTDY